MFPCCAVDAKLEAMPRLCILQWKCWWKIEVDEGFPSCFFWEGMGFSEAEVLLTLDTIARKGVILTTKCLGLHCWSWQLSVALGEAGIPRAVCQTLPHFAFFFSREFHLKFRSVLIKNLRWSCPHCCVQPSKKRNTRSLSYILTPSRVFLYLQLWYCYKPVRTEEQRKQSLWIKQIKPKKVQNLLKKHY